MATKIKKRRRTVKRAKAKVTCPHCKGSCLMALPKTKCVKSCKCKECGKGIKAKKCCLFCDYGSRCCPACK